MKHLVFGEGFSSLDQLHKSLYNGKKAEFGFKILIWPNSRVDEDIYLLYRKSGRTYAHLFCAQLQQNINVRFVLEIAIKSHDVVVI